MKGNTKLEYYADYLRARGYKELDYNEFLNDILISVIFTKNNRKVVLNVEPNDKPRTIEGFQYEYYDVRTIVIESDICNVSNFWEGSKKGITLGYDVDKSPYIPHDFSLFEQCIDIQDNFWKHEIFIMEEHIKNVKWLNENVHQFLVDHDYTKTHSSLFCVDARESSDFIIEYSHPNTLCNIVFYTDCITGHLICSSSDRVNLRDISDVEEFIQNEYWKTEIGNIKPQFKYFYDKTWNINTYKEVCAFLDAWKNKHWGETFNLPEKYIDKYKQYQEKREYINTKI